MLDVITDPNPNYLSVPQAPILMRIFVSQRGPGKKALYGNKPSPEALV